MDGKLSEFAGAGFPRRPIPPSLLLLQVLRPVLLSTSSSLRSFQKPKLWVELENRLFKMKFLTFSKTTLSISLPWCSDLPFSFPPFTFVSQLYSLHAFLCSSPLHCSFSQSGKDFLLTPSSICVLILRFLPLYSLWIQITSTRTRVHHVHPPTQTSSTLHNGLNPERCCSPPCLASKYVISNISFYNKGF